MTQKGSQHSQSSKTLAGSSSPSRVRCSLAAHFLRPLERRRRSTSEVVQWSMRLQRMLDP